MADLPKLARVGDSIECDVRHPFPNTIRMKLDTPAATAHANELLMDPKSGWRLAALGVAVAPRTGHCLYCGADTTPGSQCTTPGMADRCALYQQRAATVKIEPSGVNSSHGGQDANR